MFLHRNNVLYLWENKYQCTMKHLIPILLISMFLPGCASIPRATVDMSIRLEQQLYALKDANASIINSVFDAKEENMLLYLDQTLFPKYVDELFKNPAILSIWDEMVQTEDANERLEVITWLNKNINNQYRETKDSLINPINDERKIVLKAFDDEFSEALQMNSTITRNIASANEIHESYRSIASGFIDANRLDSIVTNSIRTVDKSLNSVQKVADFYLEYKDKVHSKLRR